MAGKFEIYKDSRGEYRFRLKASNGEVVATGESYPTKRGVQAGIEAVKRAAAGASVTDLTQ
jgi:uncharacterized protein YegP (UPF0339 family)